MMKITGLSHLFKWEDLHNWWLTKYFFAPLYEKVLPPLEDFAILSTTKSPEFCDLRERVDCSVIED